MQYTFEQYKGLRAEGYSPRYLATHNPTDRAPGIDWDCSGRDGMPCATWEAEGFTIRVRLEYDEHPDLSYIGKYVSRWEDGAIKRPNAGRNEYEYFLPAFTDFKAQAREFSKLGFDKQTANLKARAIPLSQFKFMEDLNNGNVSFVGVIVTASRSGIELAQDSIWGVEYTGRNNPYIDEIAQDCESEVIAEAKNNLHSLCG